MVQALLLVKFAGLMLIGGGVVTSATQKEAESRKRAVMVFVAIGMMMSWTAGYLLTRLLHVSAIELWPVLGALLPLLAYAALLRSLKHPPGLSPPFVLGVLLLLSTVAAMVWKPYW